LFSANYRDFLGYIRRDTNTNYQILNTANSEPENFWVFNNGLTAITHQIDTRFGRKRVRGFSIINGAQTSGALGNADPESIKKAKVTLRIVECKSADVIDDVIQYNNTQNDIKPEDRRSKDPLQKKIQQQFEEYNIPYSFRRSAKRISSNSITAKKIASVLCAFHGSPQISYRNPKKMFKDDTIYRNVFPENIEVEHIFLLQSLSRAFDEMKKYLKKKVADELATQLEQTQYHAVKHSASKHFVLFLVGELAEEIMGRSITNLFDWKTKPELIKPDNTSVMKAWSKVLGTLLPQVVSAMKDIGSSDSKIDDPYYDIPRSDAFTKKVAARVKTNVASLIPLQKGWFTLLKKRIL
jgi:hypothetical protein